VHLVSVIV